MSAQPVVVGRLGAPWGVRGWLHLRIYAEPADVVIAERRWLRAAPAVRARGEAGDARMPQDAPQRRWTEVAPLEVRPHGRGHVVRLDGVADRDAAARLSGQDLALPRSALPPAAPGEYYWADLLGLPVQTTDGRALGRVRTLMETGANDVLVLEGDRERLVPFVLERVVREVTLPDGPIVVDWDPDD